MNAWLQVLNYLKTKVNTQSYQTWLRPTRFSHVDKEAIVVCVPNREFQEWIQENYAPLVTEALQHLNMGFKEIRYILGENAEKKSCGRRGRKTAAEQTGLRFRRPLTESQVHLRHLRGGLLQPIRSRRGPRRCAELRPKPTTHSSFTGELVWARRISCRRLAT